MLINEFNKAIDFWINALDEYDWDQMIMHPMQGSWSMGQVYVHLIEETNFQAEQIRNCASSNSNQDKTPNEEGNEMFSRNGFPDILIVGPPSNDLVDNPKSKEELIRGINSVKLEINSAYESALKSRFIGKTKHPGLGFFGVEEWLQFSEMHLRHHMRQKSRIDKALKNKIP